MVIEMKEGQIAAISHNEQVDCDIQVVGLLGSSDGAGGILPFPIGNDNSVAR